MDDGASLFRAEATQFALARHGAPRGQFGLASWSLVLFLSTLALVCCVFVSTAKYARKETVVGLVIPSAGVSRVSTARAGVVQQVLVDNGDGVAPRVPLFVISYDSVLTGGQNLSERLDEVSREQAHSLVLQGEFKRQQIVQARRETQERINGLQMDVTHLDEQLSLQRDRVAMLEKDYNAALTLIEKQFISQVQLGQKRDALLQSRQTMLQVEQNLSQAKSQIAQLKTQLRGGEMALSEAAANLELNLAQNEEKKVNNAWADGGQIVAQRSGTITNLQARVGDLVVPGQTLALLVPSGREQQLEVNLWVPSKAVGFVHKGTKVRMMFDAFPYQTFGVGYGKVMDVSTAPLMPAELPVPIKTEEQMYRIVVALEHDDLTAYGRNWKLMPGMRLTADLVLEEKSFLDWLLDPLLAFRKRAAG